MSNPNDSYSEMFKQRVINFAKKQNYPGAGAALEHAFRNQKPRYVESLEDYENAPHGTVISADGSVVVYVKYENHWETFGQSIKTSEKIAGGKRQILRFGRGDGK